MKKHIFTNREGKQFPAEVHQFNYVHHVHNYPWGFKLKTEAKFYLEFSPLHGFRSVQETMNPKTGQWCKPKKSTYDHIALPAIFEGNKFRQIGWDLYHTEKMVQDVKELCIFWELWNNDQRKYILQHILLKLRADSQASYIYAGLNEENGVSVDELLQVNEKGVNEIKSCLRNGYCAPVNFEINYELYQELKKRVPATWTPFKVTSYTLIGKEK